MKTLTPEQRQSLLVAVQPLLEWMNENAHPHCLLVVDQNSYELFEGQFRGIDNVHLKD